MVRNFPLSAALSIRAHDRRFERRTVIDDARHECPDIVFNGTTLIAAQMTVAIDPVGVRVQQQAGCGACRA